jgi:alpha-tubulin suppressor-like RCC1 family protein
MTDIRSVQAERGIVVALDSSGSMWSWGFNYHGALGHGNEYHHLVPAEIELSNEIINVAVGRNFVLALDSDGQIWSWGKSPYGLVDSNSPSSTTYFSGMTGITGVHAGSHDGFVTTTDNILYSWGYNSSSSPTILDSDIINVSASARVILRQTGSNEVRTNGNYFHNNERIDFDFTASFPEAITSIVATDTFYAALTVNGHLYVWSHLNHKRDPIHVSDVNQVVDMDADNSVICARGDD